MEPVIMDGDIVVCKEVSSLRDIKENEIYAIKSHGTLWIKYVQLMQDAKGRITKLKLISANYLEHDPFEEEVNSYTRLYKVIRRISAMWREEMMVWWLGWCKNQIRTLLNDIGY